jgi:hypothetical protein
MCLQTRALTGVIGAFSDMNTNTYAGHAFRLRTSKGALLLEYVATPTGRMSFDTVQTHMFCGLPQDPLHRNTAPLGCHEVKAFSNNDKNALVFHVVGVCGG